MQRNLYTLTADLLLAVLANYLAFWLRFDGAIPDWAMGLWLMMLPVLAGVRAATLLGFGVYKGLWRYTSLWELRNIVWAVATGTLIFSLLVSWGFGLGAYPRSVYIMDAILLIVCWAGIRVAYRVFGKQWQSREIKPLLIYGAGDEAEMVARELIANPSYGYKPIGFVHDDPKKTGRWIHGVPVLGVRAHLPRILATTRPCAMLVATRDLDPKAMRDMVALVEPYRVPIKTVPNLGCILDDRVVLRRMRDLAIEDLLDRAPVGVDLTAVRRLLAGKSVLVTGAGGSIGSELCRQIVACRPHALILYERYENNLYAIHAELADRAGPVRIHALVGDVTDAARLESVMREYRPNLIFHAAAHKHVPLMESNVCEAAKNNIFGTRTAARLADRYGAERFILISTDKAVNPTSFMGATKRIAELVVQEIGRGSQTAFTTVRFGNVLGSNGSVVPRFLEQIKAGGPVTVTHPDMRRFFMLIPEAVQLVIQAAALGEAGAVYVLEMGEQMKVVDLARNLIRLSGFKPDEEIAIEFTGLRPGEKLFEELVGPDENVEASGVDKILRVWPVRVPDFSTLCRRLPVLKHLAYTQDEPALIEMVREIVPNYQPTDRPPVPTTNGATYEGRMETAEQVG